MPSALCDPRGAIYFCDNRCNEKAVRYWQFASVVVEEGGEARTVNLCQQCVNERLVQQGEPRLNSWQWRAVVEKKAHRGRIWSVMRGAQYTGKRRSWTFGYCAGNLEKKHCFSEAHHCVGRWKGRSHIVVISARTATVSPLEEYRPDTETAKRRSTAAGGAQSVEKNMNGEHPTGFWWCSSAQTKMRQKFSERTRSHKGFVKFDQCAQAAGEPAERW